VSHHERRSARTLTLIPTVVRANFSLVSDLPLREDEEALIHNLMIRWTHAVERNRLITSGVLSKGVVQERARTGRCARSSSVVV